MTNKENKGSLLRAVETWTVQVTAHVAEWDEPALYVPGTPTPGHRQAACGMHLQRTYCMWETEYFEKDEDFLILNLILLFKCCPFPNTWLFSSVFPGHLSGEIWIIPERMLRGVNTNVWKSRKSIQACPGLGHLSALRDSLGGEVTGVGFYFGISAFLKLATINLLLV